MEDNRRGVIIVIDLSCLPVEHNHGIAGRREGCTSHVGLHFLLLSLVLVDAYGFLNFYRENQRGVSLSLEATCYSTHEIGYLKFDRNQSDFCHIDFLFNSRDLFFHYDKNQWHCKTDNKNLLK